MVFYKVEIFQIKDDNAMRDKKPRRCGRSVHDLVNRQPRSSRWASPLPRACLGVGSSETEVPQRTAKRTAAGGSGGGPAIRGRQHVTTPAVGSGLCLDMGRARPNPDP